MLGIANERFTGHWGARQHKLSRVTPEGHRIYVTPLSTYGGAPFERTEIRGVGIFDNRVGRAMRRVSALTRLDLSTSRLWPVKPMLFVKFKVNKADRKAIPSAPALICDCGGRISPAGVCDSCGHSYADGRVMDLVAERKRRMVVR